MLPYLCMILLLLVSVFLIVLVLVQRGKGGGLAGALGGMGGQSAFGAKAGDLFTRVTIVVAAVWILLCIVSIKVLKFSHESPLSVGTDVTQSAPAAGPGEGAPAAPAKQSAPTAELPASDNTPKSGSNSVPAEPAK